MSKLTACYEYKSFWSYWNVKGYLTNEKTGEPLRDQLRLAEYLQKRDADPELTFRAHVSSLGKAIEA